MRQQAIVRISDLEFGICSAGLGALTVFAGLGFRPSFCSFDTLSVACYVFSGDSMKKLRAQFECAILVDGRTAWTGKRPVRVYRRIRARHPRAKISIRWTLKEGTLIASSEISLSYWA